jgi:hypothetical protein
MMQMELQKVINKKSSKKKLFLVAGSVSKIYGSADPDPVP